MSTAYLIPLSSQAQTFTIALGGVTYTLTVKWCDPSQCWTLDIADAEGDAILGGIPLVTGADLLEQYAYLDFGGKLIVQSAPALDDVPTFETLGTTGNLYFVVA